MGKRIAYLDCFSGASGDMLLSALLDAGLNLEQLKASLSALDLGAYELRLVREVRRGIAGTRLQVVDHSPERAWRTMRDIRAILESSALPEKVREQSLLVFGRLAEAEATVHGVAVEEVHFHEVGALDTLVDVVGFCSALQSLGIEAVYASALPLGRGTIRTQHGLLPVPAPATLLLLAKAGAPVLASPAGHLVAEGELVTPTGAAIISTLATFGQPPMVIQRVGHGLGQKEFPWANLLRIWIGEEQPAAPLSAGSAGGDGVHRQTASEHDHAHALLPGEGEPHHHDHPHPHGE